MAKLLAAHGFAVQAHLSGPELGKLYAEGPSPLDEAAIGHVVHARHAPAA